MIIETEYKNEGLIFNKDKLTNWSPTIDVFVTNIDEGQISSLPERFLIDSGASLTIMGPKLEYLFKGTKPINSLKVAYGGSSKDLNVYNVKITVKGYEFEILAALDTTLKFKHHLLGVTKGFDHFDHLVLNNKKRTSKLIKKYR